MQHDRPRASGARSGTGFVNPGQPAAAEQSYYPRSEAHWAATEALAYVDEVFSRQMAELTDAVFAAQAAVSAAVAQAASVIAGQAPPSPPASVQPLSPMDTGSAKIHAHMAGQSADQTMAAVDVQLSRIGVRPLDAAFGPEATAAPGRPPGAPGR